MRERTSALILSLALGSAALAQDGGKLSWKGKGSEDPRSVLAEARRQHLPALLFFTSEG